MTDPILPQLMIDPESNEPKYLQLQRQIEAMIANGTWGPNRPQPSETVLSSALRISIMTVRQAMSGLVTKGLIVRIKGRGTFVLPRSMQLTAPYLRSFTEDVLLRHGVPSARILAFEIMLPPPHVATSLKLTDSQPVLFIRRLRFRDDQPITVHYTYLSFTGLTQEELEANGSLYVLLEKKGVRLDEAEETLKAVSASAEIAKLLNIQPGEALLRISRITRNDQGQLVEFAIANCRGDLFEYSLTLRRANS